MVSKIIHEFVKAVKGGERAGHKYLRREKTAQGYKYIYEEPGHTIHIHAEPSRTKAGGMQVKFRSKHLEHEALGDAMRGNYYRGEGGEAAEWNPIQYGDKAKTSDVEKTILEHIVPHHKKSHAEAKKATHEHIDRIGRTKVALSKHHPRFLKFIEKKMPNASDELRNRLAEDVTKRYVQDEEITENDALYSREGRHDYEEAEGMAKSLKSHGVILEDHDFMSATVRVPKDMGLDDFSDMIGTITEQMAEREGVDGRVDKFRGVTKVSQGVYRLDYDD